jgi:hypothetical protein
MTAREERARKRVRHGEGRRLDDPARAGAKAQSQSARERLDRIRAEREELALRKDIGELVSVELLEPMLDRYVTEVAGIVDGLAEKYALLLQQVTDVEGQHQLLRSLAKEIRDALGNYDFAAADAGTVGGDSSFDRERSSRERRAGFFRRLISVPEVWAERIAAWGARRARSSVASRSSWCRISAGSSSAIATRRSGRSSAKSPPRSGWTQSVICNLLGYFAHVEQTTCVAMFPKEGSARNFDREKFEPMVESTPALARIMPRKSRVKDQTALFKSYPAAS